MKHFYRILCLLLILSVALLALVSCQDEENPNTDASNSGSEGTTSEATFRLPKQDFGGVTITFLTDQNTDYYQWEVAPQELVDGDRVNNAFYNRAHLIEQEYGIILEQQFAENQSKVIEAAKENIMTGSDDIQVYIAGLLYLASLTGDELLLDLSTIDSNDYLDFTQPYWDQSIVRDMTVQGSVYFATGDALVTDDESTWAIYFNKDIADDYRLAEKYNAESIYDIVNDGKWTLDVMYEMAKQATTDMGDYGMAWGVDTPDIWGIISQCYDSYAFTAGCAQTLMRNDGMEITITAGEQQNINAFDKIFTMLTDKDYVAISELTGRSSSDYYGDMIPMFANGKGLFMPNKIAAVSDATLRNANIHYGLLPMPKYDESQDNYTTTVTVYWCSAMAIPITNVEKLDATCFAMEAMAYYGMEEVTPEYYEHTLKDKRFEDTESMDMLDLIFRNRTYDMGAVFNFGGSLGFYTNLLITGWNGGTNTHVSSLESVQNSWQTAINDYIEQLQTARLE